MKRNFLIGAAIGSLILATSSSLAGVTIKPNCWEEDKGDHVERHCSGEPTLQNHAQQEPSVSSQPSYPPSAPPPVVTPPLAVTPGPVAPPYQPQGFYGPGFYVGPEGFRIGPIVVPNPNYNPGPYYPPQAQAYASPTPQCFVNVGADWGVVYALNLRTVPDGPVIGIIPNGDVAPLN
jgi:hypothetical protein